jgi:hypothetical protein
MARVHRAQQAEKEFLSRPENADYLERERERKEAEKEKILKMERQSWKLVERDWADKETQDEYKDKIRVFSSGWRYEQDLMVVGGSYLDRQDGAGDASKMYWLQILGHVHPEGIRYVFGSKGGKVYELEPEHSTWSNTISHIAYKALKAAGMLTKGDSNEFHVVCRYAKGQGVGIHTDNDYESATDTIVSMNAVGSAVFSLVLRKGTVNIQLEAGDIVVFDRSIKHSAGPAQTHERVNITVRYASANREDIFKWPHWYIPKGRG